MALAIGTLTLGDGILTLGAGAGADGRCAAARTAAGDATGLEPWSVPLGLRGDGAFPPIDGALRAAGRFDALGADAAGAVRAAGAGLTEALRGDAAARR